MQHTLVEQSWLGKNAPLLNKYPLCISIIIPIHKVPSFESKEDHLVLEKAITKVTKYLEENYDTLAISPLLSSLDRLISAMDVHVAACGVGLFVSEGVSIVLPFFFPVKEKVIISTSFEIRDLIYQNYYSSNYLVLYLTQKEARLFQGKYDEIIEVKDLNFPRIHEDDYEYSRPSRGSSYVGSAFLKDFEQDKSRLRKLRYERFLKLVDDQLCDYLNNGVKLLLAGVESDISTFKNHTKHGDCIVGQAIGNYSHRSLSELADSAWQIMKTAIDGKKAQVLNQFWEEIGKGHAITGLLSIWRAAIEGRAYQLLVEKDFVQPGFLIDGDNIHLHLKPPNAPHKILPDAIDDLIQLVLSKEGEVIIVENGTLQATQRIALITRY